MWWPFPVLSWGSLLALLFFPVMLAAWAYSATALQSFYERDA